MKREPRYKVVAAESMKTIWATPASSTILGAKTSVERENVSPPSLPPNSERRDGGLEMKLRLTAQLAEDL